MMSTWQEKTKLNLDFIIIGAQKASSTFIHTVCLHHPKLWSVRNEVPFFEFPHFRNSKTELANQLPNPPKNKFIGIKRPVYLTKDECPRNIYSLYPEVKLIVILRNPIDRFISAYFHYLKDGFIPPLSFEEGVMQIIENPQYIKNYPRANELFEFGMYGKYLQKYLEFFRRDQILVLIHDDLKNKKQNLVNCIFDFLEVDRIKISEQVLNARPMKGIYKVNPTRIHLNNFKNKLTYYRNEDNTRIFPYKNFISKGVGKAADILLEYLYAGQKPNISKSLKNKLLQIYLLDIELLEQLTSINLEHWKK